MQGKGQALGRLVLVPEELVDRPVELELGMLVVEELGLGMSEPEELVLGTFVVEEQELDMSVVEEQDVDTEPAAGTSAGVLGTPLLAGRVAAQPGLGT